MLVVSSFLAEVAIGLIPLTLLFGGFGALSAQQARHKADPCNRRTISSTGYRSSDLSNCLVVGVPHLLHNERLLRREAAAREPRLRVLRVVNASLLP